MDRLDQIRQELRAFVAERDWAQFHDPKNLAMAVVSEAGELAAEYRERKVLRPDRRGLPGGRPGQDRAEPAELPGGAGPGEIGAAGGARVISLHLRVDLVTAPDIGTLYPLRLDTCSESS